MGKIKNSGDFVQRLKDEMVRSITGLAPNFHTDAGKLVGDDYHLGVSFINLDTGKNLNEVVLIISARITAGGRLVAGVKAELGYVLYECDCDNPARIYGECGRIADDIAERFDWTKVNLKSEFATDGGGSGKLLENGGYAANALIADAICDRMGWTGEDGVFSIPVGFGNNENDNHHCSVVVIYAPNGNVGVRVSSGTEISFAELHFVNADVCESYGVDLIADLLLRDIHKRLETPFWFCMKFGGAT